jgi:hypothetical protein
MHAVCELREEISVQPVPLLPQHLLDFLCGARQALVHLLFEDGPEILDGVEIRGIGWEVEHIHSMIVEPGLSAVRGVLRGIVLLEPPLLVGIEMQGGREEAVLQDVHVVGCIE